MPELPKLPKTKFEKLVDLFTSQERALGRSVRLFLSGAVVGLGTLLPSLGQTPQASVEHTPRQVAITNKSRRESIEKLIFDPVAIYADNEVFAGHSSHRSHRSHSSHRSHTSHYSGASPTAPPPAPAPVTPTPVPGPALTPPSTPTPMPVLPSLPHPAQPETVRVNRIIVTTIQVSPEGRILHGKNVFGDAVTFYWTNVTAVKRADGSSADIGEIPIGEEIQVTWVERDLRRMILMIMLPR